MNIEKLQNKIEKKELSKNDVILILYLLHNPDYPYHIAKIFREMESKGEWNVQGTKMLSSANKLYKLLNRLVDIGILKKHTPKAKVGRRTRKGGVKLPGEHDKIERKKVYYKINPQFFQSWNVGGYEEIVGNQNINFTFFLMESLSPGASETVRYINKIKKFDFITILLHIKKQLETIRDFYKIIEYLNTGSYTESTTKKKSSGKIILEKKRKVRINKDSLQKKAYQIKRRSFMKVEKLLEEMEKRKFTEELKFFRIVKNKNTLEVNRPINIFDIIEVMVEFYETCISAYINVERFGK